MSTINNSYEYYESNNTLLSMLASKKTGNELINQIIADNETAFQKRMEEMGVTTGSSTSKYSGVSDSSANLLAAIEDVSDETIYNTEAENYDQANMIKAVSNFVTAYNSEITSMANCGGSINTSFLAEFKAAFSQNETALEAIGLSMSKDGKLAINQDTLAASDASDVEEILATGSSYMSLITTSVNSISEILDKALSYTSSNYTAQGTLLS